MVLEFESVSNKDMQENKPDEVLLMELRVGDGFILGLFANLPSLSLYLYIHPKR